MMVAPDTPPDRWMCPLCHNIVEEVVYATLPRRLVQGPGGKYTVVECPICHRQTSGLAWTVVEVVGAEEIA